MNTISAVRVRGAVVRHCLLSVTLLCCGACTSIPNFLRPPQPRASLAAAHHAAHEVQQHHPIGCWRIASKVDRIA